MYDNSKRGTRNVRSENLNEALDETSENLDNVSSIHLCLQILLAMKIVEMTNFLSLVIQWETTLS